MTLELIETTIQSLSHDGRGITTIHDKTTFVNGALPTEKVTCKIIRKHRRFNEAEVKDVMTQAPERTEPLCAHYSICGGCSMQHVEIESQVQIKQKAMLDQLKHFGKVEPFEIMPPLMGQAWGYRRKARLGVRYVIKKEKLLIGFREKSSNYLADIETCEVLHPSIGKNLSLLKQFIRTLSHYDQIPQIEIAVSDEVSALVIRHMSEFTEKDLAALCEFGRDNHFTIYLQPGGADSVHKIWPKDQDTFLRYFLPDYQLEMRFSPLDFTQVNGEMNRAMIAKVIHLLELQSSDTVLDLFCGLGNFTLPIARFAKQVIGVEGSHEMVKRATDNALHNNITNCQFYAMDLTKPNETAPWLKNHYDKILLDPPRTGAKEIIPFIANKNVKRIIYVSCNPATLARDAGELVHQYHYTLKKVGVINMFPHTSHIEAIAVFEK